MDRVHFEMLENITKLLEKQNEKLDQLVRVQEQILEQMRNASSEPVAEKSVIDLREIDLSKIV